MTKSKKQFLFAAVIVGLALLLIFVAPALAQEQPTVRVNEESCGRITALVTNAPIGAHVRFQLGHDLVKGQEVSEQDTPVPFDSGPFPAGDWGFSVRIIQGENDTTLLDKIVTVRPCQGQDPNRTLEVTDFDCNTVSVLGNGWMPTEATIEVQIQGIPPKQVQPESEGVFHTTLDWPSPPRDGQYTATVLIDNIEQIPRSEAFAVSGCGELPFTGPTRTMIIGISLAGVMLFSGLVLILLGRKNHG